ncbi:lipopolysaccharide biosynthesis protein [Croceicoccus hydrothermalis]|uniref:lipopolysaccharide biosynthesis protein n=1 Tax=Croceicoccus hydrothermalis TaxID=2867964 RepID=UPI001EFA6F2D|nr:oligosaccharide flippase family protein [Croceicoccus hydrothermalis]
MIKALVQKLFGGAASGVFRGMAQLATGTIAARLVGLATTPLITRLYTPAEYGTLSVFTALIAMIVPFMALQYSSAIPLPKHDGVVANLLAAVAIMTGVTVLIVSLAILFFGPVLVEYFSAKAIGDYLWLLIIGVVGAGAYEIASMCATRRRDYKLIAKTTIIQSFAGRGVQLALGYLGFKAIGLLIGQIVTQSAGIASLLKSTFEDLKRTRRFVTPKRMIFALSRFRAFPFYRLPSQLLLSFSNEVPILFVAGLFNTGVAGQFGLAASMTALPMRLVGNAVGKAYYAEVAALGRKRGQEIYDLTKQVVVRMIAISLPPTIALLLFGSEMFALVFGENWRLAGSIASILSLYLTAQLVCGTITQGLAVIGKDRFFLIFNIERTVSVAIAFGLSYYFKLGILNTTLMYSILLSAHRIIQSIITLRLLRSHAQNLSGAFE